AGAPAPRPADLVAETGAVARVERMIAERVGDALAALDSAPVDRTARTALTGLAAAATSRRA
ncbi:polyprenyl synthetase family protein, partial [Micromonospora sp. NPDC049580]